MHNIHRSIVILTMGILTCGGATNAAAQAESQKADTEWGGYNGGYDATNFSSLTQINKDNVASLQEVARFKIPEIMSFQSGPVVIGDIMYVTTLVNTYATDARNGPQRWVRHHELKDPGPGRLGRDANTVSDCGTSTPFHPAATQLKLGRMIQTGSKPAAVHTPHTR
jgi:glucose dehydrogenase